MHECATWYCSFIHHMSAPDGKLLGARVLAQHSGLMELDDLVEPEGWWRNSWHHRVSISPGRVPEPQEAKQTIGVVRLKEK